MRVTRRDFCPLMARIGEFTGGLESGGLPIRDAMWRPPPVILARTSGSFPSSLFRRKTNTIPRRLNGDLHGGGEEFCHPRAPWGSACVWVCSLRGSEELNSIQTT